ncbi:dopamine receptor 2-like [Orbicella faveolata]|uniref:dopamine receptor 2-like n=1 Tax=Orbicella faveolata TaxID=48498 RepID=UPI0009E48E0A|nr:dopamine receptor 2-like [Orbicella faveolata]
MLWTSGRTIYSVAIIFLAVAEATTASNSTKQSLTFTTTTVAVSTMALAIVMVLALLGNTLVCFAFYHSTNLRCVTNVFIVSLAITDILVASVSIPIWLVIQNSECINNWSTCDPILMAFWKCLDILFSTASIMNLCAISCDRYIAITSPLRYSQIITKTRAIIALICLWLYSTFIATINLHGGIYYPTLVFVVSFLLPLSVMIYSYSRIFLAALHQARRIQPMRQAFYFKREIKAAKTLAIVMGAFIVCWTPFFVMNILVQFVTFYVPPIVTLAIKLLHYGNSALNPVIYSSSNRDFRHKILRVLPCKCGQLHSNLGDAVAQFWTASFRTTFGVSTTFRNESAIERSNSVDGEITSTRGHTKDENSVDAPYGTKVMRLCSL